MISQRVDGTWNRAIVAGAKPYHFLISHLIEGTAIVFIQFLEYAIYTLVFLSTNLSWNSAILMCSLLFLSGMAGLVFGLFLSVTSSSVMASLMLSQIFVYPVSFLSGE